MEATTCCRAPPPELDSYAAAAELAANHHLPTAEVLAALRSAYGVGADIPDYHLPALGQQIEASAPDYEEHFEGNRRGHRAGQG